MKNTEPTVLAEGSARQLEISNLLRLSKWLSLIVTLLVNLVALSKIYAPWILQNVPILDQIDGTIAFLTSLVGLATWSLSDNISHQYCPNVANKVNFGSNKWLIFLGCEER